MKHGAVLASVFVFYTNALLASAAQHGSSPNDFEFGCELPRTVPRGRYILKKYDIEEDDDSFDYILVRARSEVSFQCDLDHVLLGQPKVFCIGNNQWETTLPKCQIRSSGCLLPKNFPRGSYTLEDGEIEDNDDVGHNWIPEGFLVNFQCYPGYNRIGPSKVLCEGNNLWDSTLPRCQISSSGCIFQKNFTRGSYTPEDGEIKDYDDEHNWIPEGFVVNFQCDLDYILVGTSKVLCKGDYQWNSSFPRCQIRPSGCKLPKNFTRGSYTPEDGEIKDYDDEHNWIPEGVLIKFQCDPDYNRIGASNVLCEGNNLWDSDLPRCQMIDCHNPTPPDGGYWKRKKKHFARLVCNEGYVLKNSNVSLLKCVEDNQMELNWRTLKKEWPMCIKLAECPDPGSPASGSGNRTAGDGPFYENRTVSFECEEEFQLVGQETIRCQEDSTWDFPRARCKPNITCDNIPDDPHRILIMTHDSKIFDFYVPGNMVEVSCVPGFRPNTTLGSLLIVCDSYGDWDTRLAVCQDYLCSSPESPKNGYLLKGNEDGMYEPNSEIGYRCRPGYRLFGNNWNQCTDLGWKYNTPECEEVTCVDPGSPENGRRELTSSTFEVNSTVVFKCFDGYKMIGSAERKCMNNGQWDGTLTICTATRADGCPNPGEPINGLITGTKSSKYQPGDVVHFGCNPDFTLKGSANRTCQADKRWNGDEALCMGRYDVDRLENVKFNLLDELDTKLALQDTQYDPRNGNAMEGNMLDLNFTNTGGHLVFYLVFDSSDSVGKDNFQTSIKFATALIKRVGVSKNVHVGLVCYGSKAKRILSPFNNTMEIVMKKLSEMTYLGGGTATKIAMKMVRDMVIQSENNFRNGMKSIVFLVTDGLHNVGGNPDEEAKMLKDMGVEIYVIGLMGQRNINRNSLLQIASTGDKYVFYTAGYETMEYLVDELTKNTVDYSHCGISVRNVTDADPLIWGGRPSTVHWPWMVHFAIRKLNQFNQLVNAICGGSIIENSWILSAAHCFQDVHIDNVTATAGVLNLGLDNDGNRQTRSVERIWKHPLYKQDTFDYDLALVKLKTPLQYGKYIRRICLPPNFSEIEKNSSLYRQNEVAVVIGFGRTEEGIKSNELREVDILIQNETTCKNSIRGFDATMTERMVCAGDPKGKKDSCKGDSGGPLMQEVYTGSKIREAYWIQVGVVSWSIRDTCGIKGHYGFYTHLAKLKDSVLQEIKIH